MESLPSRTARPESSYRDLERYPSPALTYALLLVAAAAMVTRFLTIPWDFGGFFFQTWTTLVGIGGFSALWSRLKGTLRILAAGFVFALVTFLMFGTIYFAPQALFPFLFFGAAGCGAIWLWSRRVILPAALVTLLLVPLLLYCSYGIRHMSAVSRFRSLKGSELSEILFMATTENRDTTIVSDPGALARIAEAFRSTSPYSPNHEGRRQPLEMILVLTDGSRISLGLGQGNRAHPETAWIQLDAGVYQNPELPRALSNSAALFEHRL